MADPTRQWLSAIGHLVTHTQPPARLLALGEHRAALAMPDGSLATLVCVEHELSEDHVATLQKIVRENPHAHLKHVVVGGDPTAVRAALRACQPKLSMARAVQVFHLGSDGEIWVGGRTRRDSPVGKALGAAAKDPTPPQRDDIAQLVRAPSPPSPEEKTEYDRGQRFLDRYRVSRPRATWAMVAAIAVVYGLEVLWGGGELIPTLVRMGANTADSLGAEPWRLGSSVLLHSGIAHAAINGIVLVMLGGFLERIVGAARLVLLLVVAGLMGSLASGIAGAAALSVGASGAIWGALGAAAVLALRPTGVIPDAVVPSIRRAAIINLVLNLTVSFLPQVDLWAHLGGGLAGAALVHSGLLTRGLPGVTPGSDLGESARGSTAVKTAAVLSALLLGASLAIAIVHGRPWEITATPELQVRALGDDGATIEVPTYFPPAQRVEQHGRPTAFIFGYLLHEPFTAVVIIEPHALTPDEVAQEAMEVAIAGPRVPEGATIVRQWSASDIGYANAFSAEYSYPNGVHAELWYQVQSKAIVQVDTEWWPDAPASQLAARTQALQSIAQ